MHTNDKSTFTQRTQRRLLSVVAAVVGLLLFASILFVFQNAATAVAPNRASVVMQFDNAARLVRTVEVTEPISGLKALELTGIEIITRSYSFGDAVCSINGVGCPAEDCFCSSDYWS